MAEPTLQEKIKSRQEHVRQWMLADRVENPLFQHLASVNGSGQYMEKRWYSFGQVALHDNGSMLGVDGQWAEMRREMNDWPSLLWVAQLKNSATFAQAEKIFSRGREDFVLTTAVTPVRIVKASWSKPVIKQVTQLQVWEWLGPIGGVMPAAPVTTPDPEEE